MSVVGAVLGLGDRHPNNILWDGRKGELLHIDHNVCFDRGQKLRVCTKRSTHPPTHLPKKKQAFHPPTHPPTYLTQVPEVVPFRLTPALVAALGPLGVHDGAFRAALETTLRAMRYVYPAHPPLHQPIHPPTYSLPTQGGTRSLSCTCSRPWSTTP